MSPSSKDSVQVTIQAIVLPEKTVLLPGVVVRAPPLPKSAKPTEVDGNTLSAARTIIPGLKISQPLVVAIHVDPKTGKHNSIGTFCRLLPNADNRTKNDGDDVSPVTLAVEEAKLIQGLCRARILSKGPYKPGKSLKVELLNEAGQLFSLELIDELKLAVQDLMQRRPQAAVPVARVLGLAESASSPGMLVDIFAAVLPLSVTERLEILNQLDVVQRCRRLCALLAAKPPSPAPTSNALVPVRRSIDNQGATAANTKSNLPSSNSSSRFVPRPQKKDDDGMEEIEEKLRTADVGAEGRKIVDRELKRVKRMSSQQAEYQVARTYLETLADIPWNNKKPKLLGPDALERTQISLDKDHYGLERVKKRLVEYVAVTYLRQRQQQQLQEKERRQAKIIEKDWRSAKKAKHDPDTPTGAPILLLVGPPGVGKTSLAKSTARALGRELYRISLGGVRDEAEIRGHRRTYIGAMPGVIVQALRKSGTMNPVLVLDEIDKVGQGAHSAHGDPAAALLEVLDPAQNSSFVDHYVGFPIDLSQVTFIATANSTDTIPGPLLDRMEVINIEGYTYLEKKHIARQYLLPKQLRATALEPNELDLDEEAMHTIATRYTRESGVRNLERQIGALCRAFAVEMLQSPPSDTHKTRVIGVKDLKKYLGLEKFYEDVIGDESDDYVTDTGETRRRHTPGLVNGLAYMGSGSGGILVFEVTKTPGGAGKLQLTGKLGSVISESAHIALSWVRTNAHKLGIAPAELKENDFHLHAPAGAIPKDGPSAGVAMTTCFVSALTGREVPRDLAMTGEITLRGKILPVGGIREKLLGAHLAGVRKVILPYYNQNVVEEECEFVKDLDIQVVYAKYIWDVFAEIWPDLSPKAEGNQGHQAPQNRL